VICDEERKEMAWRTEWSDSRLCIFEILILNLVNALPSDDSGSQSFFFRLMPGNIYSASKLHPNKDDGECNE
jgi:hypothetical protein